MTLNNKKKDVYKTVPPLLAVCAEIAEIPWFSWVELRVKWRADVNNAFNILCVPCPWVVDHVKRLQKPCKDIPTIFQYVRKNTILHYIRTYCIYTLCAEEYYIYRLDFDYLLESTGFITRATNVPDLGTGDRARTESGLRGKADGLTPVRYHGCIYVYNAGSQYLQQYMVVWCCSFSTVVVGHIQNIISATGKLHDSISIVLYGC